MEHLSKSERKNMDTCLRRLKQELLSMKEAGDGLHAQMNSMMGALQELKLLQVQTALDQLEISAKTPDACASPPDPEKQRPPLGRTHSREEQRPPVLRTHSREEQRRGQRGSLGTSPSSSSLESESLPQLRRVSGYTAPQADYCGPQLGLPPTEQQQQQPPAHPAQVVDLPGILYSLSREGPSLDSDYSQDSLDESGDWTSSLMSRSRNRQPLVLGDNVFADLVGNWLDLPELEPGGGGGGGGGSRGGEGGVERPDTPAYPLQPSRSRELSRRFSLTTNIFKKFLRSVRPDRDKLLKEKPGWLPLDHKLEGGELFKRPKKAAKAKGSFYLPFWAAGQQGKARSCPPAAEERSPYSGLYIDRRPAFDRIRHTEAVEKVQPLFDYNTAVWV